MGDDVVKYLRQARDLSVVELRVADPFAQSSDSMAKLETWKTRIVDVLKDSPSKDRKFLRWSNSRAYPKSYCASYDDEAVVAGELEVLPGPPQ